MSRSFSSPWLLSIGLAACAVSETDSNSPARIPDDPVDAGARDGGDDAGTTEGDGTSGEDAGSTPVDRADAGECVGVKARAELERAPVDIIWVVDNSASMSPAIDQVTAGINDLAARLVASDLDYRVIMLALRGKGEVEISGSARYAVCVPPPLAGDANCGDGARFFQSSVDVRSTQPLEQLLGTLGQTEGYKQGQQRGGEPWQNRLRPEATKSIVVVSDDNSRLTANEFEHFAGGTNPRSGSFTLPPGLLDPSWNGLFDGYVFHGLYGWGSESDPAVKCEFDDGTRPAASGETYTGLVQRTQGVRASICDGAGAWGPFFERIATAVERTARVACDFEIPAAPSGMTLDPERVNVAIRLPGAPAIRLGKVASGSCASEGGWYYDDESAPTHVTLCPESCGLAQQGAGSDDGGVDVQFGCETVVL